MKTMQKFMTILATLVMAFSLTANSVVATDEILDETEIEIVIAIDGTKDEEPDCQLNCDEPIIEVGMEDID